MKNFSTLLIFILQFFTIVRLHKNETNNSSDQSQTRNFISENEHGRIGGLQGLLTSLQRDSGIVQKKVFINGEEISIKDNFSTVQSEGTNEWLVTKENVDKMSHLINIVLSCKYSEIIYVQMKLINKVFKKLDSENTRLRTINYFFEKYNELLNNFLINHTTEMMLTLAGLVKITKNYTYKNYDVLGILLSWFLFTNTNMKSISKATTSTENMPLVNSIFITNYQIQNRLEQFMIKNCYHPEDFDTFQRKAKNELALMDKFINDEYLKATNELLNLITYPSLAGIDEKKRFILSPYNNSYNLFLLMRNQLSSDALTISWDGQNIELMETHRKIILRDDNVKNVLKYEQSILRRLNEIILGYASSTLKNILDDGSGSDKSEMCKTKLIDLIEKYIQIFKLVGQPNFLINDMIWAKMKVMIICYLMSSLDDNRVYIDKHIISLDKFKPQHFIGNDFESFLKSLSEIIICGRLHPIISNTFLDQIDYYLVLPDEFVPNYQFLITEYKTNNPYQKSSCDKLSRISSKIISLEKHIKTCLTTPVELCLQNFNTTYQTIIMDISDVMVNCSTPQYDNQWNALLMTLIYNKLHIKLFDQNEQKSFNNKEIKSLIKFTYVMKLMFEERYHVNCSFKQPIVFNKSSKSQTTQETGSTPCTVWNTKMNNIEDLRSINELFTIFRHEKYFSGLTDDTPKLLHEFSGVKFKLHWDGTEMALDEVHNNHKTYAFDIRDGYDYTNYVLKWVTTLTYSRLMDFVTNDIIPEKVNFYAFEKDGLQTVINKFYILDIHRLKPVNECLAVTVGIVNQYDGNNAEGMKYYVNSLQSSFELLGFEKHSLPTVDWKVSKRIYTLFLEVKFILEMYE